ncbi:hypothetical protein [Neptunicella sp. SCSIO 80796]|uniref:hypothetical protein n=1 Tax=Neptunicella plasticusilytica TaxID=3117012 RepID=UPI003A4DC661
MNKFVVVAWPITLFAAGWAGYQWATTDAPSVELSRSMQTANQSSAQLQQQPSVTTRSSQPYTRQDQSLVDQHNQPATTTQLSASEKIASLQNLFEENSDGTDYELITEAYLAIKDFNITEIEQAIQQLLDNPSNTNFSLLNILLSRYAQTNPLDALQLAQGRLNTRSAKSAAYFNILKVWSKNDPQSAYYWYADNANTISNGAMFNTAGLRQVFNGLASVDLNDAVQKLLELSPNKNQIRAAMIGIAKTISNPDDYNQLMATVMEYNNPLLTQSAIQNWARNDPYQSIDWLNAHQDLEGIAKLRENGLQAWVYSYPEQAEQAANWYLQQNSSQSRQQNLADITRAWAINAPQQAINWIQQQNDSDSQQLLENALRISSFNRPDFVIDNLSLLQEDKSRLRLSQNIYRNLSRLNPQKAEEFKNNSEFKPQLENFSQRLSERRSKTRD